MPAGESNIVWFWLSTTCLILTLSGLMITLFQTFQTKLLAQTRIISELKSRHDKDILQAQLEMQELIFQNIAHEIHDNIIHSITLTNLQLSSLVKCSEREKEFIIAGLTSGLSETIFNLNNISKGLNRDVIQQQGLLTAVELEVSRIKKLDLFRISYEISGDAIFLDNDKELILFRIIQEAFQNIIKHANAQAVFLSIDYKDSSLQMTVKDDGVGLPDSEKMSRKVSSSGLRNIEKRVKLLSGDHKISSSPSGTILSIVIPY